MSSLIIPACLPEDELNEEFLVRNIVERGDAGLDKLNLVLAAEASGTLAKPKALTGLRPASEMRACKEKLKILSDILQEGLRQSDDSVLTVLQSRVTHLYDRVHRLQPVAKSFDGIFDLVSDVTHLEKTLEEARAALGSADSLAAHTLNEDFTQQVSPVTQDVSITTIENRSPIMSTVVQPSIISSPPYKGVPACPTTTIPLTKPLPSVLNDFFYGSARNSMPFNLVSPPNADTGIIAAMQQQRTQTAAAATSGVSRPASHPNSSGAIPKGSNLPHPQTSWTFPAPPVSHQAQATVSKSVSSMGYSPPEGGASNYPPYMAQASPQTQFSPNQPQYTYFQPHAEAAPPPPPNYANTFSVPYNLPPFTNFLHPPVNQQGPEQGVNIHAGGRPGQMYQMGKWNLQFRGLPADFPVDEFLFRVETLARSSNIAENMLPFGMHYVLHGVAQEWYWVYHRDNPQADWNTFKSAMRRHFSLIETQVEIREKMSKRKQRAGEVFNEFYLVIAGLAARLHQRMPENELIEILRANMAPELKNALLFHPTNTVAVLQDYCKRFERLWQTELPAATRQPRPTFTPRVHEISAPAERLQCVEHRYEPQAYYDPNQYQYLQEEQIAAIQRPTHRANLMVCWNCDEMGHSFDTCTVATRNVFCYGCGAKNAYKPSCIRCNPGNSRQGGPNQHPARPSQILKKPNP